MSQKDEELPKPVFTVKGNFLVIKDGKEKYFESYIKAKK